jgi:gas vesicle protein
MENDKVEVNGNGGSASPLFWIGLATGIAVMVLIAPRSGAATRRFIGRTVKDGEDWMNAKATVAQDYVKSRGADLRERVRDVAEVIGRSSD